MIVELGADGVVITEPDNCRRLHVAAAPAVDVDAALRAAGLGRLDAAGDALLVVSQLHDRAAALSISSDWETAWESMIDYAVLKGWATPDRREVAAHVETS